MMPRYRLVFEFGAADDDQAARLAKAWSEWFCAEFGAVYEGCQRLDTGAEVD